MDFINYAKAVASSAWMATIGGRGDLKALKRQTAMVIPGVLPSDVCGMLISRIEEICSIRDHPRVWRDSIESDTRIIAFENDIPDLMKWLEIGRWIKAIDAYLGLKTKSWFLMANRVVTKPQNLGSGGGLHRDSPFSHQVKCIWYLSDVTPLTGPFRYLPGTHKDLLSQRSDYPIGKMRFERVHGEMVEVHAPAGSLLICDTKCIHGGKPIQEGVRYALTLYTSLRADGTETVLRKLGLPPLETAPKIDIAQRCDL